MELKNLNLIEFCDEVFADKAVPGGGSVAAYAGALGAGLVGMVGNMILRKALKREVREEEVEKVVDATFKAKNRMIELIDLDAKGFDFVMEAYRLPKDTEEQKALRKARVQEGYKYAIIAPLETLNLSYEILCQSKIIVEKCGNSASDVLTGIRMLSSAIYGAIYNVKINLAEIADPDYVRDMNAEILPIEKDFVKLVSELADGRL
ncbi:MAG: cyclodeaminase/cyclohydrolase family protein [Clostridia bacterium]|nr:cyclodeaminase/cyclohydrolase family protein [Clostridia bacterium]